MQLSMRGADDDVLFGLDGGHDVPHRPGPAPADFGQQRVGDVRPSFYGARVGQVFVENVDDLARLDQEPPPAVEAHAVGDGGAVERDGDPGSPVGYQRLPVFGFYVAAADVPALRGGFVNAPEAQDAGPVRKLVDPLLLVPLPLLKVVGFHPSISDVAAQVTETLHVLGSLAHAFQTHVGAVQKSLLFR